MLALMFDSRDAGFQCPLLISTILETIFCPQSCCKFNQIFVSKPKDSGFCD